VDIIKFNPEQNEPDPNKETAKIILFQNTEPLTDIGIDVRISINTARELRDHRKLIYWDKTGYCYRLCEKEDWQLVLEIINLGEAN
jgi:hypothetical protein